MHSTLADLLVRMLTTLDCLDQYESSQSRTPNKVGVQLEK